MAACRAVFRAWPNKRAFFAKILNGFKMLMFLPKKLHRRCSTWLKIGFWQRVWNIELTLVPSLQIKPKKYWARKYVWRFFLKRWKVIGDSKHKECLRRSSRPQGSLKKMLWEIRRIHKKTSLLESLFCCFLVNFAKLVTLPFFQNSTGQLLLNMAVSIVA